MAIRKASCRSSIHQPPSVCTCVNVRRASRAITRVYDKVLEPADLKVTQYSVLANIMHFGPLNVSSLAAILKLDRTTLVRNLKSLESAGYIENASVSDPRERSIGISEAGRAVLERAKPYWRTAQKQIQAQIGIEGINQLNSLVISLEKLVQGSENLDVMSDT